VAISPTSFGNGIRRAEPGSVAQSHFFGDPFGTAGRYRPPWSILNHDPCISGVTHFLTLTVERR
jgi:hypothetical protein